jgi:hypothetical protein
MTPPTGFASLREHQQVLVGMIGMALAGGAVFSHDRDALAGQTIAHNAPTSLFGQESRGITLSGLLNAIDGVTARDGRILFITSNKPDHLDAALLRPGRIDVREHIGLLGRTEACEMYEAFRPAGSTGEFERRIVPALPMSAATLQNLLLTEDAAEPCRLEIGEAA